MHFKIEVNRYEYERIERLEPDGALLDAMLAYGAWRVGDAWTVDVTDMNTLAAFCAATGGEADVMEHEIEIVI